ncbi:MAG: 6-carboxytetrahydropterin synthase [Deltaproteobacteria bacterium]|jgi:6-pyruvoyltetrahydropterin/6-carboxytetrahydropterin synthase|nr:6-carboxytetrahydropterin synthase [Deltaproteobacteria bacterium]
MYTVSKTFSFCYGHRLLRDKGKCRHLHGHSAKVTINLGSNNLDENGMVVHFDALKNSIGNWISESLDHNLIISNDDPIKSALDELGERHLAIATNPTAENIAQIIFNKSKELGLPVIGVEMWESETSKATYKE